MITLYKHQQEIVDLFPKRYLIAHSLGTGKTITALALAKKAHTSTLIVCPKMLKPKWEREAQAWLSSQHLVLTKEEFKKHVKTLDKYDAIIIDEAHNTFGSLQAQGHKMMVWYIAKHNPMYVWALTGTPYTSTPFSVFALARILGHKWNWYDFRGKYFRERYLGKRVIFEPKEHIENEIAELVRSIGSVVRLDECIDVPEQTFKDEKFTFTKEQVAAIKALRERETNPLVRFGKLHQIASGILIGDGYRKDEAFPAAKNDWIIEQAEQNEKMIVFSRYNLHLELLAEKLAEKNIPHRIVNGASKDRDSDISLFESLKRCILLVQADCAEGWEASSCRIMVHASHGYSYVKYNQSCGRILRINNPKPNIYITLTTEGSMDEPVLDSLKKHEDFHEAIFCKSNEI